ncbi:hypothetical protein K438DRAFT_1985273 [Mycena galopus ATCC 62051]|nr:hypothetical protein K438DRAFT_1985273 [Mycena galopus ATCC 62051]
MRIPKPGVAFVILAVPHVCASQSLVNDASGVGNTANSGVIIEDDGTGQDASSLCEPTDPAGNTLEDSAFEASGMAVACSHTENEACIYSTSSISIDSELHPGSHYKLHDKLTSRYKPHLKSHFELNATVKDGSSSQSIFLPTTLAGSASQTSSTLEKTSVGSMSSSLPAGRISTSQRISTGAVAGIAVTVALGLLGVGVILILWRCRRQQHDIEHEPTTARASRVVSPFNDVRRERTVSVGEVATTGDFEAEAENPESRTVNADRVSSSSKTTATTASSTHPFSQDAGSSLAPTASSVGGGTVTSEMEAELQASRAQIHMLVNRIAALEAETISTWRPRDSEPPPEYT